MKGRDFRHFTRAVALMLVMNASVAAQTPAGLLSHIQWDQPAVAGQSASQALAFAQSIEYYVRVDANATPGGSANLAPGLILAGVTCAAPVAGVVCIVSLPATLQSGTHTITLTAKSASGESLQSQGVAFTIVPVPATPNGPRIIAQSADGHVRIIEGV